MIDFRYPTGATPIDLNEMEGLKVGHITTREELNRFEQDNINDALQWIEGHRQKDILTEKFVRALHTKMFGKVWSWAGNFRRSDKNIGVDWMQIPVYLHNLLQDVRYWIDHETYSTDEIAVRFHHKLVWIHLFANGNGRHARLMTDILLKDILKQEPFTWNMKNINIDDEVRKIYISALKKADRNDYLPLLEFVRSDLKKQ